MGSRIWWRWSEGLIYMKNIRAKVTLPREFPRRPLYVPSHGFIWLSIPAGCMAGIIYFESLESATDHKIRDDAYTSIKETIDLPANDLKAVHGLNFHPVRIRGHFDHDHEVYVVDQDRRLGIEGLLPRGYERLYWVPFTQDDKRLLKRSPGHWVITPFILSDGKTKILVNRGWVPLEKKDPATRASAQVQGEVELTGLVRTLNQPCDWWKIWLKTDPASGNYSHRDIPAIARDLKTLPVWIDLDRKSSDLFPGGPIGGQTSLEYFNDMEQNSWMCVYAFVMTSALWYFKFVAPVRPTMF